MSCHDTGLEILNHDINVLNQLGHKRHAARIAQIDTQTFLAAIVLNVKQAALVLPNVEKFRPRSPLGADSTLMTSAPISASMRLHVGAGESAGEIEDAESH